MQKTNGMIYKKDLVTTTPHSTDIHKSNERRVASELSVMLLEKGIITIDTELRYNHFIGDTSKTVYTAKIHAVHPEVADETVKAVKLLKDNLSSSKSLDALEKIAKAAGVNLKSI